MNTQILKTEKEIKFINELCGFSFEIDTKEISGSDYTDKYNLPRCYNKTTKSFKKALNNLIEKFDDNTTMYLAMNIISDSGIRMRSYCSMD